MSLFAELKRRNVIRVAMFYLVTAWLVIQVGETLMPIFNVPDWALRAVVFIMALGFIPAIVFSWLYELTPEGLKKESEVVRDESITHLTARRMDQFTIAVVVLGVGVVLLDRFVLDSKVGPDLVVVEGASEGAGAPGGSDPHPGGSEISIAVLPFVNMSSNSENEYFSDGISEELLNVLVKVKGLRVASRTSAFSFKGKDVDIPTVASALKVRHVVEGSVRRSGEQVRITAQLIDVETDSHLWSDSYTRQMKDIFAIQDEIAKAIAEALKVELLGNAGQVVATHSTEMVDAFEQYLLGRYYFNQRTAESLPKAIELFEQVIELDPDYAAAYSGLADSYLLVFQYGDFDFDEALARARVAAEKALMLDPDLAEAHASYGLMSAIANDVPRAMESYDRAIELNPSYSMSYIWKGNMLVRNSVNLHQVLEVFLAGERVDPLHPLFAENIGDVLLKMGRYDDAENRLLRAVSANPDSWLVSNRLSHLYLAQGRLADAHRAATIDAKNHPDAPNVLQTLIDLEMRLGRTESADFWIQKYQDAAPSHVFLPFIVTQRQIYAGELSLAADRMESSIDDAPAAFRGFMRLTVGQLRLQGGDPENALSVLEQVDQDSIGTRGSIALSALKAYVHALLYQPDQSRRMAEQGLGLAKNASAMGSREPWLLHLHAVLLAQLDRLPEAEQKFEEAYQFGYRLAEFRDLNFVLDRLLSDSGTYRDLKQTIQTDVVRELALIEKELSE